MEGRHSHDRRLAPARRQVTAQCSTALFQVGNFTTILGRPIEAHLRNVFVGQGEPKPIAKFFEAIHIEFFLLV